MKKAILVVLAIFAGLVVVTALGLTKYFQIQKIIAQHANFAMPPESVTSVAEEEEWSPPSRPSDPLPRCREWW